MGGAGEPGADTSRKHFRRCVEALKTLGYSVVLDISHQEEDGSNRTWCSACLNRRSSNTLDIHAV